MARCRSWVVSGIQCRYTAQTLQPAGGLEFLVGVQSQELNGSTFDNMGAAVFPFGATFVGTEFIGFRTNGTDGNVGWFSVTFG